jgi:hypothetical protein
LRSSRRRTQSSAGQRTSSRRGTQTWRGVQGYPVRDRGAFPLRARSSTGRYRRAETWRSRPG